MKRVSVIITCYNHEKYIEQCLKSIFRQTYQNIELFVINDGSLDDSDSVIRKTLKRSPFKTNKYLSQDNKGSCISRNIGLDWATGDFVLMVDSDNYLEENHIEKSIQLLEQTKADIAYTSLKDADTQNILNEVPVFDLTRLINVNYIDTCSLIRSSILGDYRFDLHLNRLFMQDFDFFLGLIAKGANAVKVEGLYQNYRVLPHSVGNRAQNREQRQKWFDVYNYILAKHPDFLTSSTTQWFAGWYDQLNEEFIKIQFENAKLNSRNYDLYSQKYTIEQELLGKEKNLLQLQRTLETEKENQFSGFRKQYKQKVKSLFNKKEQDNSKDSLNEEILDVEYQNWIDNIEDMQKRIRFESHIGFGLIPSISILVILNEIDLNLLKRAIQSIKNQWYPKWEVCFVVNTILTIETQNYLNELLADDSFAAKIVTGKENQSFSVKVNTALEFASGEYFLLMSSQDMLASDALFEFVDLLNNKSDDVHLVYSDEDLIDDQKRRFSPTFKPDWSPDLIMNQNYIARLCFYNLMIAKKIDGFRSNINGMEEYDFTLRYTEQIDSATIFHLPKILYHKRPISFSLNHEIQKDDSTARNSIKVIEEALKRRNVVGEVGLTNVSNLYNLRYAIRKKSLISIIISGTDDENVKKCINSIIEKTSFSNYEIIIASLGEKNKEKQTIHDLYKEELGERFKLVYLKEPLSPAKFSNKAAAISSGEYLLFLDSRTEISTPDWLEQMLSFAQFERIGCVGARITSHNDEIQLGGIILGLNGVAEINVLDTSETTSMNSRLFQTDYNYTAISSACLMINRGDFIAHNGFDEELEEYHDVDLSIRLYQAGKWNILAHNAVVNSFSNKIYQSKPAQDSITFLNLNEVKIKARYGDFLLKDPAYNPNLTLKGVPFKVKTFSS
ncbi:glycosyltransferase family 2 protein [Enterococcus sp. HY326]|uniref:glycosyltransferase family 2 protein n=1 Tax=Enterococcus sp. HY326 TaxID=2971265 RepID=UPI00223EE6E7|nr:glycosyltransferase [Enterococcus sp. HY326]